MRPDGLAAPTRGQVVAALLGVQFAFATLPVAGKIVFTAIEPDGVVFVRVLTGAMVFFAVLAHRRQPLLLPRADWGQALALAVLGVVANQVLFLRGLHHTSAINATVIGTTIPVFTVVVALILGRERGRPALYLGVPLALGGVAYLVGAEAFTMGEATLRGDIMVIVNALSYALYLVFGRALAGRYGPLRLMAFCFAAAVIMVAPLGASALVRGLPHLTLSTGLALAWIAASTVFAYLANTWALAHAASSTVAIFIYLQPIVTAAFAVTILGERPSPRVGLAAALVFAGIALVTRRTR